MSDEMKAVDDITAIKKRLILLRATNSLPGSVAYIRPNWFEIGYTGILYAKIFTSIREQDYINSIWPSIEDRARDKLEEEKSTWYSLAYKPKSEKKYDILSLMMIDERDSFALVMETKEMSDKIGKIAKIGTQASAGNCVSNDLLEELFNKFLDIEVMQKVRPNYSNPGMLILVNYFVQLYFCITVARRHLLTPLTSERLFSKHRQVMMNYTPNKDDSSVGKSSIDNKLLTIFDSVMTSNLTTVGLTDILGSTIPKELVAIIIGFDQLSEERLLEPGTEKSIYADILKKL
jgi:hypothetical protein